MDEYVKGLPASEHQVGAVFAIAGEVVGLDLFDADTTFQALAESLVRSYALDALESPDSDGTATADAVEAFLKAVAAAPSVSFKAVGLGDDLRLGDAAVSGAALSAIGGIVHLCAYPATASRR